MKIEFDFNDLPEGFLALVAALVIITVAAISIAMVYEHCVWSDARAHVYQYQKGYK